MEIFISGDRRGKRFCFAIDTQLFAALKYLFQALLELCLAWKTEPEGWRNARDFRTACGVESYVRTLLSRLNDATPMILSETSLCHFRIPLGHQVEFAEGAFDLLDGFIDVELLADLREAFENESPNNVAPTSWTAPALAQE